MNIKINDLKRLLEKHHIPYQRWGVSVDSEWKSNLTRPLECLLFEVNMETSTLAVEDGRLIRSVEIAEIDPYHPLTKDTWHRLVQHSHQMPNDRMRYYRRLMGVTKKIRRRELPINAAFRGIEDELRHKGMVDLHPVTSEFQKLDLNSRSFPGLFCRRRYHNFACIIPEASPGKKAEFIHVRPDGVKVCFRWRPVSKSDVPGVLLSHHLAHRMSH